MRLDPVTLGGRRRCPFCESGSAMRAIRNGNPATASSRGDNDEPAFVLGPPFVTDVVVTRERVRGERFTASLEGAWNATRALWTRRAVGMCRGTIRHKGLT